MFFFCSVSVVYSNLFVYFNLRTLPSHRSTSRLVWFSSHRHDVHRTNGNFRTGLGHHNGSICAVWDDNSSRVRKPDQKKKRRALIPPALAFGTRSAIGRRAGTISGLVTAALMAPFRYTTVPGVPRSVDHTVLLMFPLAVAFRLEYALSDKNPN
jgi:hypothetical protein